MSWLDRIGDWESLEPFKQHRLVKEPYLAWFF